MDRSAAAGRVALALPPIASLFGKCIAVLSPATQGTIATTAVATTQPSVSGILDEAGLSAFKRLQKRAEKAGVDLWGLLWLGDTAGWEDVMTQSFAAGMGLELEEGTVQQQVRCFVFSVAASSQCVQQLWRMHAAGCVQRWQHHHLWHCRHSFLLLLNEWNARC
jgi:hypothetical protein